MSGRPYVLLDVDGVLNLGLFMSSRERKHLRRADGWYSGRAGGDPHDPLARRIVLNRRWGPLLRALEAAGAELAWATGWTGEANWEVGPLLGLPELPVAPVNHSLGTKAETVIPWTQGRPWAWLEDLPGELAMARAMTGPGVPHLPVLVDPAAGLTNSHVNQVLNWLEEL